MVPYDDDEYIAQVNRLFEIVQEFLDVEGNTPDTLRAEIELAIDNVGVEL